VTRVTEDKRRARGQLVARRARRWRSPTPKTPNLPAAS
jgi:hypothetical protein